MMKRRQDKDVYVKKWLVMVLGINVVAAVVVYGLSQVVDLFKPQNLCDFLFFITVVIWALAGFVSDKSAKAQSTISWFDRYTAPVRANGEFRQLTKIGNASAYMDEGTGLTLFVAGIPAFAAAFMLYLA